MDYIIKAGKVGAEDLRLINAQAKSPLTEEQVYTFAVRLCDNEVDRDWERFDRKALETLAELFNGVSGLFDHNWTAKGQTARLYKTEVVEESTQTSAEDQLCWLKGYAYMVRTEETADLITEIEAGIKREVSVGCSVGKSVCSICGAEPGSCGHRRGCEYDGKLCFFTLQDPMDAYEWSFVAVPAQRGAGVVKHWGGGESRRLSDADVDRIAGQIGDRIEAAVKAATVDPPPAGESEEIKLARARLRLMKLNFGGIA